MHVILHSILKNLEAIIVVILEALAVLSMFLVDEHDMDPRKVSIYICRNMRVAQLRRLITQPIALLYLRIRGGYPGVTQTGMAFWEVRLRHPWLLQYHACCCFFLCRAVRCNVGLGLSCGFLGLLQGLGSFT